MSNTREAQRADERALMADNAAVTAAIRSGERHGFVDALRGFALLGILLVNIEFIVQPSDYGWAQFDSNVDRVVRWLVVALGQTKVYPLFALLFGYGLSIQVENARARGTDLTARYRRRMVGIVLLGIAHGILFFPGDILVIYGVIGAISYRWRDVPSRTLVKRAAITYGLATIAWLIIGALDAAGGSAAFSPIDTETYDTFAAGSFGAVIGIHFFYWIVTLGILSLVQGPAVFAMFMLGIALGRTRWLADPEAHRDIAIRVLKWMPLGLLGAGLGATLTVYLDARWDTLGFAIGFGSAPILAASYLAGLAIIAGHRSSVLSRVLQAPGRMSLTVYLLESVVVSTLAYGYGFGLFGTTGPALGVVIATAVWLGLGLFSVAWLRFARFGPFEWALRSFTYGRVQPLVKPGQRR